MPGIHCVLFIAKILKQQPSKSLRIKNKLPETIATIVTTLLPKPNNLGNLIPAIKLDKPILAIAIVKLKTKLEIKQILPDPLTRGNANTLSKNLPEKNLPEKNLPNNDHPDSNQLDKNHLKDLLIIAIAMKSLVPIAIAKLKPTLPDSQPAIAHPVATITNVLITKT